MTIQPRQTARYYKSLRAAHLERADVLNDGQLTFYGDIYYDIKPETLLNRPLVIRSSPFRMLREIRRRGIEVLEINEPAMLIAWPDLIQILVGTSRLRRRGQLELVAYAITNMPVEEQIFAKLRFRSALIGKTSRWITRQVVKRLSRIAFGTSGSQALYLDLCPEAVPIIGRRFTAMPCPSEPNLLPEKIPFKVVFLGAFDERKGIRLLMAAWPHVATALEDARLTIIGKGPLEAEVSEWCRVTPTASLIADPARDRIAYELRSARVLVLLSQRVRGFREQIGLPILEGLSYGCTIVTTEETGISEELTEGGHFVLPAKASVSAVSETLSNALLNPVPVESVLSSLPAKDGRLLAHQWLMNGNV